MFARNNMKNLVPAFFRQNGVVLVLSVAALLWVGYTDGLSSLGRYALYLAAIVGNGAFLQWFLRPAMARPGGISWLVCLSTLALNMAVAFSVYPKLPLVLAFWLPALMGYAAGRFVR